MLIRSIYIISALLFSVAAFAQQPTKTVDIISKSGKKLSFSDIKIESEAQESYKTLEIRYKKFADPAASEVDVDGKKFKSFKDKKSAVSYYYVVKKTSEDVVIYYVYSVEERKPEVFTFRVLEE